MADRAVASKGGRTIEPAQPAGKRMAIRLQTMLTGVIDAGRVAAG
jgi:hypothetical protein